MRRPGRALALLLVSAAAVGPAAAQTDHALPHYELERAAWREKLPPDLAEVSGLAFTADGRLLAHGDERAVVWRYDLEGHRPTGRFGLGDHAGVRHGDFEEITVIGERLFLPLPIPTSPTLALRVGGKRLWGSFPFDEAALLGGQGTLRGFEFQRFAGDAMVHGSVEVRVPVARGLPRLIPTEIEMFGLGDAGRVWADGTESDRVRTATGAGIWLSFFEPLTG